VLSILDILRIGPPRPNDWPAAHRPTMDLYEKIRTLPTQPGVYLYKNAEGEVIYVGKANNLRSRVRSYLLEAAQANAKTGSLMREAVDLEYILVANESEALALETNLIKQRRPRFNILLKDDKSYPYVKLTLADRFPKVFVTRRLLKDGAAYYGPYFPGSLAETGGRQVYKDRSSAYVDFNRVTKSLRQPGSAMKPIVYLAAFQEGTFNLESVVPDEPISVANGTDQDVKWISNYDGRFKGMIPLRMALAESRNAVAVWITEQIGVA